VQEARGDGEEDEEEVPARPTTRAATICRCRINGNPGDPGARMYSYKSWTKE